MIRWLRLHCFLLEKVRVNLTVRLSTSWPMDPVIHITKRCTIRRPGRGTKSSLQFCRLRARSSLVKVRCGRGGASERLDSAFI